MSECKEYWTCEVAEKIGGKGECDKRGAQDETYCLICQEYIE